MIFIFNFYLKGSRINQILIYSKNIDKKTKIVNSTLFNRSETKFIQEAGIWKIELRTKGKLIMTKNFLVIPSDNDVLFEGENGPMKREWIDNFKLFYKYDSTCFKSIENSELQQSYSHTKMFKSCVDSAEWSSFYPDPKSDLISSIGVDTKLRLTI